VQTQRIESTTARKGYRGNVKKRIRDDEIRKTVWEMINSASLPKQKRKCMGLRIQGRSTSVEGCAIRPERRRLKIERGNEGTEARRQFERGEVWGGLFWNSYDRWRRSPNSTFEEGKNTNPW